MRAIALMLVLGGALALFAILWCEFAGLVDRLVCHITKGRRRCRPERRAR